MAGCDYFIFEQLKQFKIYVLLFNLWKGVAAPEQRKSVSNKLARVLTQLTQVRIHLSDQSQVLVLSACCDEQFPSLLYNSCMTRTGIQWAPRDKVNVRMSRATRKVSYKNGFIFRCVELFWIWDQWCDREHILCNVCICVVSALGGTANLFNHIKSLHEVEYEQCMKPKTPKNQKRHWNNWNNLFKIIK